MNTNKNAINSGNFEPYEPKPDCKVSIEQILHPIEKEEKGQGAGSKGDRTERDSTLRQSSVSTPTSLEPLSRSGGRKNMFPPSFPRQESGVISPRSLPPAKSLFVEYPNNLLATEYHELYVGSAIHPGLISRSFFHIEGESIWVRLF